MGPIKPYIFWIKIILAIFLAKTRPDKTIFSALTNLTTDFDFELSKNINAESAVFTLSCFNLIQWKNIGNNKQSENNELFRPANSNNLKPVCI